MGSKDQEVSARSSRPLLFTGLMCVALVAASCGSDGASDAPEPTSNDSTAGSVEETTTTAPSSGIGAEQGAVGAGTEFCDWIIANAQDDTDFADPVATKESTLRNRAEAEEIRSVVPSDVAADFAIVYQAMVDTNAALAANDYNLFAIPEGALEQLATESAIEASSNIS